MRQKIEYPLPFPNKKMNLSVNFQQFSFTQFNDLETFPYCVMRPLWQNIWDEMPRFWCAFQKIAL